MSCISYNGFSIESFMWGKMSCNVKSAQHSLIIYLSFLQNRYQFSVALLTSRIKMSSLTSSTYRPWQPWQHLDHPSYSKWLGSPPFISSLGHLEGVPQPQVLGTYILIMVINRGPPSPRMILQAGQCQKSQWQTWSRGWHSTSIAKVLRQVQMGKGYVFGFVYPYHLYMVIWYIYLHVP